MAITIQLIKYREIHIKEIMWYNFILIGWDLEERVVWYTLVVRSLRCLVFWEENMAISIKKYISRSTQYFHSRKLICYKQKRTKLAIKIKVQIYMKKVFVNDTLYLYSTLQCKLLSYKWSHLIPIITPVKKEVEETELPTITQLVVVAKVKEIFWLKSSVSKSQDQNKFF